ncbi:MAG TPA: preprotein translocase subunit SecY [Candidatus Sulfomarinibacteraceae bacterium]|nr:preprotein translocase subunit SecY [Candidatus Sulfomarinibacteraceae bacterium]
MIDSLRNAFALPDLRRRILFTIFMLIIYRLVANIPVPGVDLQAWLAFTAGEGAGNRLIDMLDLLSGGAVRNFSVMAMGVYPYITASIIIQLMTPIVPQLEELASEGEQGRNKINKLTYYLTVPLALLQAVGQIRLVGLSLGDMGQIMPFFGFSPASNILPTLTTLLAMTAGTMFAIWLGEQITEDGIGQGVSLIIFGGIVAAIPENLARLFAPGVDSTARSFTIIAFVILTIITVLVIVVVQEGQRRLPVQYGRRVRGRKVYQGQSTHIPLKVNTAGMIPIIFAQSLITFPALIAQFFINPESTGFMTTAGTWVSNTFGQADSFIYWAFYFILVVGFTFFYTDVMVQQQNLAQTLQRQGGFIPGIRPGRRTEGYIMSVVRRITLVGAVFLGIVAILPGIMQLVGMLLQIPDLEQSALVVDGAGLIIVVGVVIDTMRQLEAQLLMRHYEGFIG